MGQQMIIKISVDSCAATKLIEKRQCGLTPGPSISWPCVLKSGIVITSHILIFNKMSFRWICVDECVLMPSHPPGSQELRAETLLSVCPYRLWGSSDLAFFPLQSRCASYSSWGAHLPAPLPQTLPLTFQNHFGISNSNELNFALWDRVLTNNSFLLIQIMYHTGNMSHIMLEPNDSTKII